jgi:hypothetical protein
MQTLERRVFVMSGGGHKAPLAVFARLLVLALLAAGCTYRLHYHHRSGPPRSSYQLAAERPRAFGYERQSSRVELPDSCEQRTSDYCVTRFAYPSIGDNGQEGHRVQGRLYRSLAPGRKPLVVIVPIYGSSRVPSNILARRIRRAGEGWWSVVVLEGREELFDWPAIGGAATRVALGRALDGAADRMRTAVIDLRRLLDWAERQPDLDPSRFGIAGFSIGAIVASLAMGVEPRFSAGVFLMGGGDLEEIFATCGQRDVKLARRSLYNRFGWDDQKLKEVSRPHFEVVNPVRYAYAVDPSEVLLFDSAIDRCIPRRSRIDLWEALGRPERISFYYHHKPAFLSMTPLGLNYTTRKIWHFLKRRLGGPPPASVPVAAASGR